MTPYQRGCRDALLDIAAQLDELAGQNEAAADDASKRSSKPPTPAQRYEVYMRTDYADAYRKAADLARSLAERTPDDPEEPTP